LLVKAGVIAMHTIIFIALVLSTLLLVFILPSARKTNQDEQNNQLFIPPKKFYPLYPIKLELMIDNGGNRSGIDRRIFEYSACIPERRSGRDRRKDYDRRNSISRRRESERRKVFKTQSLN
jgi:hypothetical protein